jgi:hypothetical protein
MKAFTCRFTFRTGVARSEMHRVQVAESLKLEKTELEFELGQLTGQVERLQARIRTLIEEQVKTRTRSSVILPDSFCRFFKLLSSKLLTKNFSWRRRPMHTNFAPRVAESSMQILPL